MHVRVAIAFLLGAVLGAALLWLVTAPREFTFPHAVAGEETVRILVAKHGLDYGDRLRPKHLQWIEWPKAAVPPGGFTSVAALLGESGDGLRVVLRSIEPGEPILERSIGKLGEQPRISDDFRGRRAVAIDIDASSGVTRFLAPGDRVDVMLIREIDGQLASSIILRDIPVIALDPVTRGEGAETARTVTLEVSATQAQKLELARQVGRLSLTLRGLRDHVPGSWPPGRQNRCKRPWSGYRDIPQDILIPDLCRSSLRGIANPSLRRVRPPTAVRRGDFGAPRGLCERPPGAAPPASAWCADPPPTP